MKLIGKMVKYMPFSDQLVFNTIAGQVTSFYDLANTYFKAAKKFQSILIRTTPPVAESTRVPRTSNLSTSDTLPVMDNVYSEDKLNRTMVYLAITPVMEGLDEKEQELKDIEAWEIQEATEKAKHTRLSVQKEKQAL